MQTSPKKGPVILLHWNHPLVVVCFSALSLWFFSTVFSKSRPACVYLSQQSRPFRPSLHLSSSILWMCGTTEA